VSEKAEVYREVIERRTFRGSTLTFPVWRYRVPLTGLCGSASSWELAIGRVEESLRNHDRPLGA
jgi:hypothetical protein